MSKDTSDRVLSILEAYSNPIRGDILLFLKIYGKISLTELSKLIGKSKPTISKHIKILYEKNLVNIIKVRTANTPGNIDPHFYELNTEVDHSIRGEDLIQLLQNKETQDKILAKAKEILEQLMDTRIIHYQRLNRISELTMQYLERMKNVLLENADSKEKVFQLLQDHTGHLSFDFIDQRTVFEIIKQDTDNFDEVIKKNKNKDSEIFPYVYIKALLPIKRIMDLSQEDIWKVDGTLWPKRSYDDI